MGSDGGMMGSDGGMMGSDGGMMMGSDAGRDAGMMGSCGDGVVTGTETCDTAIASGMPGACPSSCSDGLACTSDALTGSGCTAACVYTPITLCTGGDGCCPMGCTMAMDADCACVPRTTCAPGVCGTVDNGCGGPLDCGTCAIGGACDTAADCSSGECVTVAASGWPGGYCSLGCTSDMDCGAGAHCGYRDASGAGACVANCTVAGDCRMGYTCRNADGDAAMVRECAPTASGAGMTGAACTSTADCSGGDVGFCIVEAQGWQGGYCTRSCRNDTECVGASHCGFIGAGGNGVCVANCAGASCRTPGYACYDGDGAGTNECAPSATGTGAVGAPGGAPFECSGAARGLCITDPEFVDGYCTVTGCATDTDCPSSSHCTIFGMGATGVCMANCTGDAMCRNPGYSCWDANGDARNECYPGGTGTGAVGTPCDFTWQCAGAGRAICATEADGFRGGYCALRGCTAGGSGATGCPTGAHCSVGMGATSGICVDSCATSADCRADGYLCYDNADLGAALECWPAATGTGAVGAACEGGWNCSGGVNGFCVTDDGMAGSPPGGYCIQTCDTRACPAGSTCLAAGAMGEQFCFDACTGAGMGDCRPGHMCIAAGMSNVCFWP